MKKIAILTGGPAAERGISMKSAQLVADYLDPNRYEYKVFVIEENGWFDRESGLKVDLNDFSIESNGRKWRCDLVFLMIHGTPAEDGKIQGYFEIQEIPHSTCDTLVSALTFNKQMCKDYLKGFNIPMADSTLIRKQDFGSAFQIEAGRFPVFVKPNNNGSSYGISRADRPEELENSIALAFKYDDEVIIEDFLDGREISCGVVKEGDSLHALPLTEIIPDNEFFDYEAKYEGASQEITPADLSPEQTDICQNLSKQIYTILGCKGMIRLDYILVNDCFNLLEVNTIPGLSEASIVPQQARAYGWTITKLLDVVIMDAFRK
jgi:D-alanine-D-alanine ligase